nr:hypothetical protein [Tanacetum cinerariifolium]
MHKAFLLPAIKFLLPEEHPTASEDGSHCQKKRDATARKIALLSMTRRNCQSKMPVTLKDPDLSFQQVVSELGKFEQWQFWMQQYLQHEHYALWEKKNDVKARTTLLLSLPDEHQLRFSQLQFMDVEVEHDDLNQKFLTSLAPEWLMHTIVWRNKSDLDTMSLDDLYNHLKVYEIEVQKKTEPNTQNVAFISSAKHSMRNDEVNTASVYTASSNVPTASANVASISISQETACAYIASQSNGKKISYQGSDVAGFDKLKFECFNCYKMGHFSRECRAPINQDRGRRDNYRQGSKGEEQAPKALMAIDGVGWDWSYMPNDRKDHALEQETFKQEKEVVDGKLAGLLTALKDLDNLIESQRSDKSKEGLGYTVVPPPPAQLYLSSKPLPTIESSSEEDQNINPFVPENVASPITPKPFVKFVKASDSQFKCKTDEKETPKKPPVEYAEQYRKPNKKPNVRGNQRN